MNFNEVGSVWKYGVYQRLYSSKVVWDFNCLKDFFFFNLLLLFPVGFFFFFREASLVVNVASDCRYTDKSYLTLKELHKEFGPYHFNVLAFPCNQFGESEPMSSMEIESFARQNYGVTFPIFHKIKILGPEAEPAFRFLVGKYLPCLNVVHPFPFRYHTYVR